MAPHHKPPPPQTGFNPNNPGASGYSDVFETDFAALSSLAGVVDVNNTKAPGYQWYADPVWWAAPAMADEITLIHGVGLQLHGVNGENAPVITTEGVVGGGYGSPLVGTDFGNG